MRYADLRADAAAAAAVASSYFIFAVAAFSFR